MFLMELMRCWISYWGIIFCFYPSTAQLSDFVFTEEETPYGKVPILGYTPTKGETPGINNMPRGMGACRNKDVEMCLVSAFAMSLWFRFDFSDAPLAGKNFFSQKKNWHLAKVLHANNAASKKGEAISDQYEYDLQNMALATIGAVYPEIIVSGKKVRAQSAYSQDIEQSQIRRAGQWVHDVIHKHTRLETYPFQFILCTGGFEPDEPYCLDRDVNPPAELERLIFPWLEEALKSAGNRKSSRGVPGVSQNDSTVEFLVMLKSFRKIILQDLAAMMEKVPSSVFSKHSITKHPLFQSFRERVNSSTGDTIHSVRSRDEQHVANDLSTAFISELTSMQQLIQKNDLEKQQSLDSLLGELRSLNRNLENLTTMITESAGRIVDERLREIVNENLQARESEVRQEHDEVMITAVTRVSQEFARRILSGLHGGNAGANLAAMPRPHVPDSHISEPQSQVGSEPPGAPLNDTPHSRNLSESTIRREMRRERLEQRAVLTSQNFAPVETWTLSKGISTIPDLMEEWFMRTGDLPSVVERDELEGANWRKGFETFYKRRKSIIKFIEQQSQNNELYRNITTFDFANFFEDHRKVKRLKMNALSSLCQSVEGRAKLAEDLNNLWEAKQNAQQQ